MLRIRDVYPGSWFLPIPDHRSYDEEFCLDPYQLIESRSSSLAENKSRSRILNGIFSTPMQNPVVQILIYLLRIWFSILRCSFRFIAMEAATIACAHKPERIERFIEAQTFCGHMIWLHTHPFLSTARKLGPQSSLAHVGGVVGGGQP